MLCIHYFLIKRKKLFGPLNTCDDVFSERIPDIAVYKFFKSLNII